MNGIHFELSYSHFIDDDDEENDEVDERGKKRKQDEMLRGELDDF